MSTRVITFDDGREPQVGEAVEIDGQIYYYSGGRRFSTQTLPASAISYDSCETAVLSTGGTLETPTYPVQDYCQDTDIDVELDRMYINPSDTISAGDKVFFNGRGFIKTGNTGTATHILTALPTVVDYDATCVLPPSGEDSEESGGFSPPTPITLPTGIIGDCIDGLSSSDYTGEVVEMSDDGNRVVVLSTNDDRGGDVSGTIRVFEYDGTSWQMLGGDPNGYITGNTSVTNTDDDWFRMQTSNIAKEIMHANGDATRVVISNWAQNGGRVRVYQWTGTQWSLMSGDNIPKDTSYDLSYSGYFGSSVRLNQSGDILAVGECNYSRVNFFQWNASTNTWDTKGHVIDNDNGTISDARVTDFGDLVSFNQSGDRVIVGGSGYSSFNGPVNTWIFSRPIGIFKSYQWDGNTWSYMNEFFGPDNASSVANGDDANRSGDPEYPSSIDMNAAGDRVVIGYNQYGEGPGQAIVYQWNTSTNQWDIMSTFSGEHFRDRFGWDVSINDVGDVIAVGADRHMTVRGKVYVYQLDENGSSWNLIAEYYGQEESGNGGRFGHSVSLNEAGDRLAVGEPWMSSNMNRSGKCCVYQLPTTVHNIYTDDMTFTLECGTSTVMSDSRFSDGKALLFLNQQLGCKVTLVVPDMPAGNYIVNLITMTSSSQGQWRLNHSEANSSFAGFSNNHYADTTNGTTSSNWQVSMPYTIGLGQAPWSIYYHVHDTPGDLELEFELIGANSNVTDPNNLQLIVDKLVLYT